MANDDYSLDINVGLNADDAIKELNQLDDTIEEVSDGIDELTKKNLKGLQQDVGNLTKQFEKLGNIISKLSARNASELVDVFTQKGKQISLKSGSDFEKQLQKKLTADKRLQTLLKEQAAIASKLADYSNAIDYSGKQQRVQSAIKKRLGVEDSMRLAVGGYATSDSNLGSKDLLKRISNQEILDAELVDDVSSAFSGQLDDVQEKLENLDLGNELVARINDGLQVVEDDVSAQAKEINNSVKKVAERLGIVFYDAADMADSELKAAFQLEGEADFSDVAMIGETIVVSAGKFQRVFEELTGELSQGTKLSREQRIAKAQAGDFSGVPKRSDTLLGDITDLLTRLPASAGARTATAGFEGQKAIGQLPVGKQTFADVQETFNKSMELAAKEGSGKLKETLDKFFNAAEEKVLNDIFKQISRIQSQRGSALGSADLGDDSAENLIRYDDENLRQKVAQAEQQLGLEFGTIFANFGPAVVRAKDQLSEMETEFDALAGRSLAGLKSASEEARAELEKAKETNNQFALSAKNAAAAVEEEWVKNNPAPKVDPKSADYESIMSSYRFKKSSETSSQISEINLAEFERNAKYFEEVIKPLEEKAKVATTGFVQGMSGLDEETLNLYENIVKLRANIEKVSEVDFGNQLRSILPGGFTDFGAGFSQVTPAPFEVTPLAQQIADNPILAGSGALTTFIKNFEKKFSGSDAVAGKSAEKAAAQAAASEEQRKKNIELIASQKAAKEATQATTEAVKEQQVIQLSLADALRAAVAEGRQFESAMDFEYNDQLTNVITEASALVREITPGADGSPRKAVSFVQAPAESEYAALAKGMKGMTTVKELASRAEKLGLGKEVGSPSDIDNLKEMYDNLRQVIDFINTMAELDIPIVGNNIQGAEFGRLAKAIGNINNAISTNKLDLEPLQAPVGKYGQATYNKYLPGPAPQGGNIVDLRQLLTQQSAAGSDLAKKILLESNQGKTMGEMLKAIHSLKLLPEQMAKAIKFNKDGSFSIDGLDAHYAEADNKAALMIAEVFRREFAPLAQVQAEVAKQNSRKSKVRETSGAGWGDGEPPLPSSSSLGGADKNEQQKSFLAMLKSEKTIRQTLLDSEQDLFTALLKRLGQNSEYLALQEKVASIQQEIAEREEKIAVISENIKESPVVTEKMVDARIAEQKAIKELRKEEALYIEQGAKLEADQAFRIKNEARKDKVYGKNYETMQKQIDATYELDKAERKLASDDLINKFKAQEAAIKGVERENGKLINQMVTARYALYDVGNAYQNVAQNMFMATRRIFDVTNAYRSYETAFTSVERAIETFSLNDQINEIGSLKDALIGMSEEIPVSFENLAQIATLGAQMGVAASGIADFTKVVAEFSAITGIETDTVAQKFGRIAELANVSYTELENLGSSIAYASINAVATEPEILSLSESIAAVSEQAGFLPPEIIAMGTTLASIGIQAEQARGVFTRVFADIDRSVSQGRSAMEALGNTEGMSKKQLNAYQESADSLNAFARTAGMSVDQFVEAWGTEGKSSQVFEAILRGLSSSQDLTAAFDSLNIVETREINTLTRLANNLNVWDQAMTDANGSYAEGSFLGEAFGKTVDNLDSKILILQNNFKSLTEELSKGIAPTMIVVIDFMNELMQIMKGVAANPLVQAITGLSLGFTGLLGAGLLATSVVAKLVAQIFAFRVAMINTANTGKATNGIVSMVKQLTGVGSGLIEMRDQLQEANASVRGVIEPVNYKIGANFKKQQAELLASQNIYIAKLKGRGEAAVQAARMEADAVSDIIRARKLEIAEIEASTVAGSKEQANRLKAIGGQTIYIETVNGETRALTQNEYAILRGVAASQKVSEKKRQEAAERLKNVTAINTETRAASQAGQGVLGFGARVMQVAGIVGSALSIFSLVSIGISAVAEAAKMAQVNILEAGGGVASLRDAIKQDTQAYNELTDAQKATTTEFSVVTVETKKYRTEVDKAKDSVYKMVGVNDTLASKNNKVAESIQKTTLALGENTRAWIANAVIQDENVDKVLQKYPSLFEDLTSVGVDFQAVIGQILSDPTGGNAGTLESMLAPLNAEIKRLEDGLAAGIFGSTTDELKPISDQLEKLKTAKSAIDSIRNALGAAITKNTIFDAINESFGVAGDAENAILDLQEAFSNASGSAEEMQKVLEDVKDATVTMLEDIDGVDPDIIMKINDAETLDAMIKIVDGLYRQAQAANIAKSAMLNAAGSSVMWGAAAAAANGIANAGTAGELKGVLDSLRALAASGSVNDLIGNDTGGSAESATDKINRLIDSALKGSEAVAALRNALKQLGDGIKQSLDFSVGSDNLSQLGAVIRQIGENANGDAQKAINKLYALKLALIDAGLTAQNAGPAFLIIHKALKALGGDASMTREELEALRATLGSLVTEMSSSLSQGTQEPEIMFKTLSDYVNGLQTVLSNAFDIRYGASAAQDELASAWDGIAQAAKDAEEAVKSANNEINSMNADRDILLYQLSVAERYGDEKRAAKIRAQLAELDQDLAKKQEELAKAQDEASGELTGNTAAAIKNRQQLRGLVQQYNSYLVAMANAGASTEELRDEANRMAEEFYLLGQEAGFSEDALREYALFFTRDFNLAAQMLDPFRDQIELEINPDPTVRAVSELVYGVNQELGKIIAGMDIDVNLPEGGDIKAAIQAINAAIDANLDKVEYIDIITRYFDTGNPADGGTGGGTGDGGTGDGGTGDDGTDDGDDPKTLNPDYTTAKRLKDEAKAALNAANATLKKHRDEAAKYAALTPEIRRVSGVEERYQHLLRNIIPQWVTNVVQANNKYETALAKFNSTPQYIAAGGFVGMKPKGTDTIPAMLTRGEFVINAGAAKILGADFLHMLNSGKVGLMPNIGRKPDFMMPGGGQRPSFGGRFSGPGFGAPNEMIVFLSPEDRQLLRAAADRPVNLYSDGVKLAQSVNNGNSLIAKRGTR